ncbi:unnamed protein product, partial [Amoebophrya sp. A25]|eukprot:GSA25T00003516001.1
MSKLARPAIPGAGCAGGGKCEGLVASIDKNQRRTSKKTTQKMELLDAAAEYRKQAGLNTNHRETCGLTSARQQGDKAATTADGSQGTKLGVVNMLLVFLSAILQGGAGYRRCIQQSTAVLSLTVLRVRTAFSDAGAALTLWAASCLPFFCAHASARQKRNTCHRRDVDARDENVGATRIMWMRATACQISISMIMLISASASILFLATPSSTWLLLVHCGRLLPVVLSCTLMAVEVVCELMLLGCLQFLLVGATLLVGLVLAYELFEALQYAPASWCPAWLGFRSNSVSGYTVHIRGSSDRNMRRWLRRFWANTCDDLSHSLWSYRYRVRHWAWTRHWAQPLRGSAAADCLGTEVFSRKTSSSRLARWQKNNNTQKKDRRVGQQPHRHHEGPALYHLLSESGSLGRRCFVVSFCCFFGTMIADLGLPSTAVFAIDNNKQRQRRKAMQITSEAQLSEDTEYYSEESGSDTNRHGLQKTDKAATTAGQKGVLEAAQRSSPTPNSTSTFAQTNEQQHETQEPLSKAAGPVLGSFADGWPELERAADEYTEDDPLGLVEATFTEMTRLGWSYGSYEARRT